MNSAREIIRTLYSERLPKKPATFTEKTRWKMRYDRRNILTLTADKFGVYDYIKKLNLEHILKTRFYATDNPKDIPFDNLPDRFVIKPNQSSGDVIIVNEKYPSGEYSIIDGLKTSELINKKDLIQKCYCFLERPHWNAINEWAYYNIKPVLIVEEFLTEDNGYPPIEYKFFCFDGKAKFVCVAEDNYKQYWENYFDIDWNPLDMTWSSWPGTEGYSAKDTVQKPANFDKLVTVAEKLSKPFDFVRIDLYNVSGKIYFSEFTHYPNAGIGEIKPKSFDSYVGDFWTLPDIDTVRDNTLLGRLKAMFINISGNYRLMTYCIGILSLYANMPNSVF